MLYIIAGTYEQARDFIHRHKLQPAKGEAAIVTRLEQLIGCPRGTEYVLIGTWYARNDTHELSRLIRERNLKQSHKYDDL